MTRISHILFDLGNTLLYFEGVWQVVFPEALEAIIPVADGMDLPIPGRALVAHFRSRMEAYYVQRELDLVERTSTRILQDTFSELGYTVPNEEQLATLLGSFYTKTQTHWHLGEGVLQVLSDLRKDGFRLGILSNAAHDPDVQALVDQSGLRPFMDFVLTSAEIGLRKPHPETFRRAIENWAIVSHRVLMVGDTLNADILGARESGVLSAWVQQYAAPQKLPGIEPDYTIEMLPELPSLLEKIKV